jgi:lysophospholipase L1-like esterase
MAANKETVAIRAEVDEVLKRREKALKARARALAELPAALEGLALDEAPAAPTTHMMLAAAAGTATKGWIVAEGDSWFDYPGSDVLDWLHQFGYDIESVARAGDRAEMMAFGRGQLDKFALAIEKVIAAGHKPKAILLSGGGNDIAGAEFGFLLNHAGSPRQGLNDSVITGVIDERVQDAYVHIIRKVTELCRQMVNSEVPIVLHGYGYPIPDGDGVLGGFGPLPGPWLRPGFIEKGFGNLEDNKATMKKLMDRFNVMLDRVAKMFTHVTYVDLRKLLPAEKKFWANELHPKPPGFKLAAEAIAKVL